MDRVFTKLKVKTIDEEQRIVEGIASTPTPDLAGDIVEPLGAEFDLPIPFLLDHDHREAVGEVEMAEATSAGIRFRARIKKIDEPGLVKDMVDRAWHLLKHGLRKTVSIGFQPRESEPLPSGGYRFLRWSWLELSAVSVPAQPDAVVTGLKRAPRSQARTVRLSPAETLEVAVTAGSRRRAEIRERLGIAPKPVKLRGSDFVNAHLSKARKRRADTRRARDGKGARS